MMRGLPSFLIGATAAVPSWRLAPSRGSQQQPLALPPRPRIPTGWACRRRQISPSAQLYPAISPGSPSRTHPLQQFAFQERFDHVVGRGEVPRLVDEVHGLEACWEGVLGCQTQTGPVTDRAGHVEPGEEVGSNRNPTLPPRPFPSLPFSLPCSLFCSDPEVEPAQSQEQQGSRRASQMAHCSHPTRETTSLLSSRPGQSQMSSASASVLQD